MIEGNNKKLNLFNIKKMLTIIILLVLAFSSISPIVTAETAKEKKARLEKEIKAAKRDQEYIKSEMTKNLEAINEFELSIEEKNIEIRALDKEIEQTQKEVEEISSELSLQQEDYAKQEVLVKKRLTFMYESGQYTSWEVLLKSSGLMDFLANYYMLQELSKLDNEILSESSRNKRKIEVLKKELESKEKVLSEAQDRVKKSKIVQENLKKLKEENVAKLSKKEKDILNKIENLKAQERAAELEIAREMAKYNASVVSLAHPDGKYNWPLPMSSNYMTTKYGDGPNQGYFWTSNPRGHLALDIADSYGTPIYASNSGIVALSEYLGGYGNCVVIDHGAGVFTRYAHGNSRLVSKGQTVKRGQKIMTMGSTGNSTGPHLHFDFFVGGYNEENRVDPLRFVSRPVPLLYRPGSGFTHLNEDIY